MSIYLRLVIGPVVVCDVDLFALRQQPSKDDPPPHLNGGQGAVIEPYVDPATVVFGFRR